MLKVWRSLGDVMSVGRGCRVWMLGAGVFLGGLAVAAQHPLPYPVRTIRLTYLATLPALPPDAKRVQVWVPLATTREGQEIVRRQVLAPGPFQITHDPVYHNDILYFALQDPAPDPMRVQVDYEVQLRPPDGPPAPAPAEVARELEASGLVVVDDEVKARTAAATAGRLDRLDQARGIYDYVIQHMAYDKTTPGWGHGDTRRACLLGKGNCTDFHSLFISMARAARIPARFKIGLVVPPEPEGAIAGYHCWAEFYLEGQGWIPVDASEAWKHPEMRDFYFGGRPTNRVLISVGRDLQLDPPQGDKPVNIFLSPYVEADGHAVAGDAKPEFTFREVHDNTTGGST